MKGLDTIHDFSHKKHDRIDLSEIIKSKFDFVGTHDFSGKGAEVRFETQAGHSAVFVDVNGDSKTDMAIAFDGTIHFQTGDFLL